MLIFIEGLYATLGSDEIEAVRSDDRNGSEEMSSERRASMAAAALLHTTAGIDAAAVRASQIIELR